MVRTILFAEFAGTPAWAWALLVNLVAAVACIIALFIETKPMAFLRHSSIVAILVIAAALGGTVIALGYALLFWWEARLWRSATAPPADPPVRRIH